MENLEEIRSLRAGEWFWISKAVLTCFASEIGFSSLAVYIFLASMVDKTQSCFPSQQYIADHLNCSRATVIRAIQNLSSCHLISVKKTTCNHNHYFLLAIDRSKSDTGSVHQKENLVSPTDTNNNNNKYTTNNIVSVASVDNTASELVKLLNDPEHLDKYELLTRHYTKTFLLEIARKVLETPSHKIKKSRYALFTYLLHYYDAPRT